MALYIYLLLLIIAFLAAIIYLPPEQQVIIIPLLIFLIIAIAGVCIYRKNKDKKYEKIREQFKSDNKRTDLKELVGKHVLTSFESMYGKKEYELDILYGRDDEDLEDNHQSHNLQSLKTKTLNNSAYEREFVEYQKFLRRYNDNSKDASGCYVILFFTEQPNFNFTNFKNVYVGQSINVYQRVRNHLTGHGNGDVYAEVKYGTKYDSIKIYVMIIPCEKKDLNKIEKKLITQYNATKSFNKTAGGSAQR